MLEMDIQRELVPPEFLAVLLAGFGNELSPLTSDHGDEPCLKALLPVANKPLLDYPLSWLEQSGIKDVLLICPAIHRPAISHHIHSHPYSSLHIDIQPYEETADSGVGTCTLLRHFSSRISRDFVLLPCDFIPPPSLPLTSILNKFRTDTVSDGLIATTCWFTTPKPEKNASPDEWGHIAPSVSIVWDKPSATLLYIDTPDDLDRNSEEVELRMSMLSRYPRTVLSSNLQDSHVYVCKRSVLDVLQEKHHFDSFREEFLPWLCKVQYQRTKREKYEHLLKPVANTSQALALKHSTLLSKSKQQIAHVPKSKSSATSAPQSPVPADPNLDTSPSLRVGLHMHRPANGIAARVNNIHTFMEMNRHFLTTTTYALPTDPTDRALIDQKAQISSDTIIGDSTKVDERTSIKKSVIGRHCTIGKMAKIVGCVLLDHCVVEDGAKLDGCVLGKNTKVGAKAELVRCVTQAGYEVDPGESVKNEKLEISDWTAGGVADSDSESD
ncbi:UDP-3-O-[3-hydroxymyristoyl] glucosamine N-acyltransferase [Mycena venus]|uniref:Translation initiation factor eIF2B subunit gamma n=1 Tax=Mycena venus TaxID=2733690 RepID=A0A8H6YMZ2_9AGAR|nr:UDP-3-O-[3-hydroxymyristoyl] glucosamine N-acyltransferase [Mycena venus]